MTKAAEKVISIEDFDERTQHDQGVEVELLYADSAPTGIFVTVVGDASARMQAHAFRMINSIRRQSAVTARKKGADVRTIEEDAAQTLEKAVMSVTGWRGPKEEFSPALLKRALDRNPSFVQQILETSADASLFTKSSPTA